MLAGIFFTHSPNEPSISIFTATLLLWLILYHRIQEFDPSFGTRYQVREFRIDIDVSRVTIYFARIENNTVLRWIIKWLAQLDA